MAREEEKTRTAFWLDKELLRRCDICWKTHGFPSRNEFVNQAIGQYMVTLTLEQGDELLVGRLAQAVAKAADDGVVKLSKGLFRYAVVQEMILHILASGMGVTSDMVERLRARAIKNVRRTRGKVNVEAIADFQNEYGQDDVQEDTRPIEERLEELLQFYQAEKEAQHDRPY